MEDIEKTIIEFLKRHPYGLTISELSRMLKINRITLSKHLEILKEKGYLNFRSVGKAKVWYVTEDINFLEVVYSDTPINKLIRLNENGYLLLGDIKFLIIPSDFLEILYLDIKDFNKIREIGKKFGVSIGTFYKMYSGVEKVLRREIIEGIIKVYEKMGFCKIDNIDIDIKNLEIKIVIKNLVEREILINLKDVLDNKDIKDHFTEGYFEGLISTIFGMPVKAEEEVKENIEINIKVLR